MLFIKSGKVLMFEDKLYKRVNILIEDGKIVKIGKDLKRPKGCLLIDANKYYVTPGLIDAHCHVGMWEEGMGFEGDDGNEMTDPVTPEMKAIDGINIKDLAFQEAYENGITTVVTGPGSGNVIGGQFVAMKTFGNKIEDMIIKEPAAMKIAFGENPKRVYSEQKRTPMTRMATAAILKEALIKAKKYFEKVVKATEEGKEEPEFNYKMESLSKVIKGELIVKAHAHRTDDIATALRIAKEYNLNMTIEHCTEGHLMTDILKETNAKPIIGPLLTSRPKIELKNLTMKAPSILEKEGIKFAMMTDHPVIPIQYLPVCASLAVREGLSESEAMKSITINAAEFTGISDRVGSIEIGKDADIVVWSGNPLDSRSKPVAVVINGKIVHKTIGKRAVKTAE